MIGLATTLLGSLGLSQRLAKALAPVALLLAALAALGALYGAFRLWDHFDDKAAVENANNEARAEAAERARVADGNAAEQAAKDDERLDRQLEEAKDAIDNAPGGELSPAAVAHACLRLRRAGFRGADLPEQCRGGGSAGGQAAADNGHRD